MKQKLKYDYKETKFKCLHINKTEYSFEKHCRMDYLDYMTVEFGTKCADCNKVLDRSSSDPYDYF